MRKYKKIIKGNKNVMKLWQEEEEEAFKDLLQHVIWVTKHKILQINALRMCAMLFAYMWYMLFDNDDLESLQRTR